MKQNKITNLQLGIAKIIQSLLPLDFIAWSTNKQINNSLLKVGYSFDRTGDCHTM